MGRKRWACFTARLGWVLGCALLLPGVAGSAPYSHAALDTVLALHVREGLVDYGALARDRGPLERYLAAARTADVERFARDEQITFWVNVYNARVLDGVIRRPGLKSVLDVGRTVGVPTLGFFRERAVTAGRKLSLNDIEHEILRKRYRDPRVHFVLNCASASCPVLPPRALQAATLDSTLDAATREFLTDRTKNRLEPSGWQLSSIFQWYREDFGGTAGVAAFVRRFVPGAPAPPDRAAVKHLDYDWSLNGRW